MTFGALVSGTLQLLWPARCAACDRGVDDGTIFCAECTPSLNPLFAACAGCALPRLDGVEATRQILGERDVPIVALTGYGTETGGIAERAVEAGVTSVVQKPFADHAVVGAVNDALAAHTTRIRERSRETLAELVGLLGYPEEWASTLESDAYAAGKIWVRTR